MLPLLAALVFAAFAPTLGNGFVGYDDPEYVTANPHVNTGLTLRNAAWALTVAHSSNWHPLTWISHALDCTLFGLNPAGHHGTSLVLHIASTLLLFWWLSSVTGCTMRSAFVAGIFGVHPLHVESVAWVAERKDVLSTLFWMLTLIAYTGYVRKPGWRRYCLTAALLAAGLAAKQMLVTVPVLLLVLDFWPLRRSEQPWRLVREKIPFLAVAALAAAAAFWAQRQAGALAPGDALPLGLRLSNAVLSYVRYLGKTVWPARLAVFYPFPEGGVAAWKVASGVVLLAGISLFVWRARRGHPWLAAGWSWYVLTLLPVIGIVQVGMQSMADRYMYVPMVGLLIAVAWEAAEFAQRHRAARPAVAAAAAVAIAGCAVVTWRQVHYWQDGMALFRHALAVTEDNYVAHDNLGVELDRAGRAEEARAEYREALRIRPADRHAEYNYAQATFAAGERLFREEKYQAAAALFQDGLRHQPGNAVARTYLGITQALGGEYRTAVANFDQALRDDPGYTPAKAARAEVEKRIR